jgi:hypothetical protein
VKVGYTALQATLTASDWQTVGKEVVVTAKTTTLDYSSSSPAPSNLGRTDLLR